jgi:hypothetical protein
LLLSLHAIILVSIKPSSAVLQYQKSFSIYGAG